MSKLISLYKQNIDQIYFIFGAIVTLIVLGVNFYALGLNLIPSDEAWYLCLTRDLPHFGSTRFHLLFGNLFGNNIYANRVFCWVLQLLGSLILAGGLASFLQPYMQKKKKWVVFFLALFAIYFGQMGIKDSPSLNYITLNKALAECGIGFLLMGLSRDRWFYCALTGFCIAGLFPVMITNSVIILPILIVIYILSSHKLRDICVFFAGMLVFVVYYFVFVESVDEVLSYFISQTESTIQRGSDAYGVVFLIKWIKTSFMYLLKCFVMACVISLVYRSVNKYLSSINALLRWLIIGFVSILILLYMWTYCQPHYPLVQYRIITWFKDLFWVFFFIFLLSDIQSKSLTRNEVIIGSLFCLVPMCLSFGTNIEFNIRGSGYYAFILAVVLLMQCEKKRERKYVIAPLLLFQFVVFLFSCTQTNWYGDKYLFGDKIPVKTIGIQQNIKLDKHYIDILEECQANVPQGRVLCSKHRWISVCMLDYMPISYDIDLIDHGTNVFQPMIDTEMEKEKQLWIISSIQEKRFRSCINKVQGYQIDSICTNNNVFYHIQCLEN